MCSFLLQLLVLLKAKLTAINETEDMTIIIIIIIILLGGWTAAVTLTAFQMVTVALIFLLQKTALVTYSYTAEVEVKPNFYSTR